jgi:hypothetical protein
MKTTSRNLKQISKGYLYELLLDHEGIPSQPADEQNI